MRLWPGSPVESKRKNTCRSCGALAGDAARAAINMVLLTELFAWQPPTSPCTKMQVRCSEAGRTPARNSSAVSKLQPPADFVQFLQPECHPFIQKPEHGFERGAVGTACHHVLLILLEGLLEDVQSRIQLG